MEPLLLMAVLVCAVHSVASLPLSPKDYRRSRHYDEQLKELRMGLEVAGSVMNRAASRFLMASADRNREDILLDTLTSVEKLINHQDMLQEIDMHQDDSTMSISLDALDILLTQVIADACNWIYGYLDRDMIGDFECNLSNVTSLATIIYAKRAVEESFDRISTYAGGMDGIDTCQWITCNILCNPDFNTRANFDSIMLQLTQNNVEACRTLTTNDIETECQYCP